MFLTRTAQLLEETNAIFKSVAEKVLKITAASGEVFILRLQSL